MKKNTLYIQHAALPTELHKRVEMVIAVCITHGHVNRDVLIERFKLTPLQASVLLREFLRMKSKEIRRDSQCHGYVLVDYPRKHTLQPQSHSD